MANYGFFVANTGSTLYSGFTFVDSQSNNITINIAPSQTFYISADESVTASTYVGLNVFLEGTLDITYDFSACCSIDSFSVQLPLSLSGFSGASYYVYYGAFSNSTRVGYGCHNITDGGGGAMYPYVTALQMDFAIPISFTDCVDCINTYQCSIDECCLLIGVEYTGGYYYRTLYYEGIINGRQFYTFTNISGDSMIMYWDNTDWEIENLTTLVPRGAGVLTTGYCPSFTTTTIDNALNCLTDLTGLTVNLFSDVISCSGCSPIFCVSDTGLGYDDNFVSAGTHNSETYWSGISTTNYIFFTTGGTWCLSTVLDGICLLEGPYPCNSTCPDLCDTYVFSGACPTPTPTPTVNCSVLDFNAIFDCEVTPTPSVTPTISTTPSPTPTPSSSNPCGGRAVKVTISGYTPTPTPTLSPTPTLTPQVTRPCAISGTVTYNTVSSTLVFPMSKQFQDCSNGVMYYTTSEVPLPSGGTISVNNIFKANINGESKCISFVGMNLSIMGIDNIELISGPLANCNVCTPDVTQTPTPTPTPSFTPTNTPTPTPTIMSGYYVYKQCGTNKYIVQSIPGPTLNVGEVFINPSDVNFNNCWEYIGFYMFEPTLPLGSLITNYSGNLFPEYGFNYFENCAQCSPTIQ